jgi:putative ABC transport system permease protein
MNTLDVLQWITRAVVGNPLRSALTGLGIAIGIAAVGLLTSVGEGLRVYMQDSFSQFGTRIIAISPGKTMTQGMTGMLRSVRPLSIDDASHLESLPYVEYVVPILYGTGHVEAGGLARDSEVFGVGHQAAAAWHMAVARGQFLPPDDPRSPRAYAVLGSRLQQELFADRNPLGALIRVSGTRFRVIGVMESKGQFLGFDLDDVVYIPVGRALQLFNRDGLMEVDVVFNERTTSAEMARRVSERLRRLHGREDFTLFTQEDMLNSLDDILGMLTLAIAALGGISLFVGGVGVLTIMTTALKERTPEIGLLSALGCTRRRTLLLFLGEAVLLAAAGGLLGLALVVAMVVGLRLSVPELPLVLQPLYLAAAWLLSLLVGLLAGIAPALQAYRLNPIEALRDE